MFTDVRVSMGNILTLVITFMVIIMFENCNVIDNNC